jgi:hypothetical protein
MASEPVRQRREGAGENSSASPLEKKSTPIPIIHHYPFQEESHGIYAVAVMDVLGYKNLMQDPVLKQRVDTAIQWSNGSVQYLGGTPPTDSGLVISGVHETDSIRIIFNVSAGGMFADQFWASLFFVCNHMMEGGYILRGGVGLGYTSSEAFRVARRIEQTTVFPRIEFAQGDAALQLLVPIGRQNTPKSDQFRGLIRANAGFHFDFLRYNLNIRDAANEASVILARLNLVKPVLVNGLSLASPNLIEGKKVRDKYEWYARYHNEVASEFGAAAIPTK